MSDNAFLFVHGSCHGAWCWEEVLPRMRARGRHAEAIDLPSHGGDTTPIAAVTLDTYAEAILAKIETLPTPVILVGHSAGGFAITAAALRAPDRVAHLAYVCAYVPEDGMSLADMRRRAPRQPVMDAITLSDDRLSFRFLPEKAPATLYGDVAPETVARAVPRLGPQPVAPQNAALTLSPALRALPRSYVLCEQDGTIPPEEQEKMVAGWPTGTVHRLPASHSPFFSMPDRLVDLLAPL